MRVKKIYIVIIISIVFIVATYLCITILKNKDNVTTNLTKEISPVSGEEYDLSLTNEQSINFIENFNNKINDNPQKIVLKINNEEIQKIELNKIEITIKNRDELSLESKEPMEILVERVVLLQEANNRNIGVSNEEMELIETRVRKIYQNETLINNLEMDIEEYYNMKLKEAIEDKKIEKLKDSIITDEIAKNQISIDDNEYIDKVNSYHNKYSNIENATDKDLENSIKEIENLYNEYIKILKSNAKVEIL